LLGGKLDHKMESTIVRTCRIQVCREDSERMRINNKTDRERNETERQRSETNRQRLGRGGEVGAGGSELDEHIKQLEAQVKTLTDKVNGEVSRLVPPVWNPVREWKRRLVKRSWG